MSSYLDMLKKVRPGLTKRRGRDGYLGCPGNHFPGAPLIHDNDCLMEPTCEACWRREWEGEAYAPPAAGGEGT